MKATIKIQMDNAAFEETPASELARILRAAAKRVEQGDDDFKLRDINGNAVGELKVTR